METNKIYFGDCIEELKKLPDNSIDLIVTDPPYEFITKSAIGGGFMKNENKVHLEKIDNSFGMSFDPTLFLNESKRILKKMNLYVFTNKSLLMKYIAFAEENKYKWEILIWIKSNPIPVNNGHYLFDKEYCIFIKERGATFNSKLGYSHYFTVFNYPIGKKETKHPTEKPIDFIKKMILISSNEGEVILDCFLGSGTTAVACLNTNRKFIGIENKKEYIDMANARIKPYLEQRKLNV